MRADAYIRHPYNLQKLLFEGYLYLVHLSNIVTTTIFLLPSLLIFGYASIPISYLTFV